MVIFAEIFIHFIQRCFKLKVLLENEGFHISRLSMRSIRQGVFGFIQSCLNYLDPKHRDFLFEVMKGRRDISLFRITAHLFTSLLLFPFALLESLISPLFRGGPVIIFVAKRKRWTACSDIIDTSRKNGPTFQTHWTANATMASSSHKGIIP